jgi:hypothetical protein
MMESERREAVESSCSSCSSYSSYSRNTQKNVTELQKNPLVHRAPTEYDQFYRLLMLIRQVDARELSYIS